MKSELVGSADAGARWIAADGERVYFSDGRDLFALPRTGGAATTLATQASCLDGVLASSETTLFLGCRDGGRPLGKLVAIPKTGGPIRTVIPAHFSASRIVGDRSGVYFAGGLDMLQSGAPAREGVFAVAPDGTGEPRLLAKTDSLSPGAAWSNVVATDETHLYVTAKLDASTWALATLPKASGQSRIIAGGFRSEPSAAAVHGGRLYVAGDRDKIGTLYVVEKSGELKEIAAGLTRVQGLVASARHVYWSVGCYKWFLRDVPCPKGGVHRVALDGSRLEVLAEDVNDASNPVGAGEEVFWGQATSVNGTSQREWAVRRAHD